MQLQQKLIEDWEGTSEQDPSILTLGADASVLAVGVVSTFLAPDACLLLCPIIDKLRRNGAGTPPLWKFRAYQLSDLWFTDAQSTMLIRTIQNYKTKPCCRYSAQRAKTCRILQDETLAHPSRDQFKDQNLNVIKL